MSFKTYEFTMTHDGGIVNIRTSAQSLEAAKTIVLNAELAPESSIKSWRVVPTHKQIRRTKSLLRGI